MFRNRNRGKKEDTAKAPKPSREDRKASAKASGAPEEAPLPAEQISYSPDQPFGKPLGNREEAIPSPAAEPETAEPQPEASEENPDTPEMNASPETSEEKPDLPEQNAPPESSAENPDTPEKNPPPDTSAENSDTPEKNPPPEVPGETPAVPESRAENASPTVLGIMSEKPRKLPKTKKQPKVKRNWLLRCLFVLLLIGALYYVYLQLTDISHFKVSFYTFEQEKIESPVRIVFLSDQHLNEFNAENAALVSEIDRLHPDMIIMGGDMTVMHNPDYSSVLSLCSHLKAIAPVYYGIGNHEYNDILFEASNILNDLNNLGVNVLSNRFMTVKVNGNLIDIGGLNENPDQFEQYGSKFWNQYDKKGKNYRLLLVHNPGYFKSGGYLVGKNIDLALCGHYHGGQILLPVVGALYHPEAGFLPKMAGGSYEVENTLVVVSRGLGNHSSLPRFNNPPELVVIDLY